MNKNNKGFMLVEVIVTSVVIATAMISLYSTFNMLYTSYNRNISYYNIDAIYATKTTIDYLLNNDFNKFINKTFGGTQEISGTQYKTLIDNNTCFENSGTCNKIKDIYKVNQMIISEYNMSVLQNITSKEDINQTFKEYIDFLIKYYDLAVSNNRYKYIVLTEIKDDNGDYYYANLGIE